MKLEVLDALAKERKKQKLKICEMCKQEYYAHPNQRFCGSAKLRTGCAHLNQTKLTREYYHKMRRGTEEERLRVKDKWYRYHAKYKDEINRRKRARIKRPDSYRQTEEYRKKNREYQKKYYKRNHPTKIDNLA